MAKKYKNDIIASCLLDILTSGRTSTQIRDQVIAVLSRYNTPTLCYTIYSAFFIFYAS